MRRKMGTRKKAFSGSNVTQLRQYRIILSADTASEVRQMLSQKSADNTLCFIEHFGNADAVPQPPERCLSR